MYLLKTAGVSLSPSGANQTAGLSLSPSGANQTAGLSLSPSGANQTTAVGVNLIPTSGTNHHHLGPRHPKVLDGGRLVKVVLGGVLRNLAREAR